MNEAYRKKPNLRLRNFRSNQIKTHPNQENVWFTSGVILLQITYATSRLSSEKIMRKSGWTYKINLRNHKFNLTRKNQNWFTSHIAHLIWEITSMVTIQRIHLFERHLIDGTPKIVTSLLRFGTLFMQEGSERVGQLSLKSTILWVS